MDPTQLLPQFGNLAFTLLAFVVALSVIVAIHEYGHYIVGRWTGIRAEVFSLGFGPVLFARTDRHGTRWQVAALPFGGYVKFLGDANAASMGGAEGRVAPSERRHTMLGAPLWARAATVAAGPLFNFALAILVFLGVILAEGRPRDPLTVASVAALPDSYAQGLRAGDVLQDIAGRPASVEGLDAAIDAAPEGPNVDYTVLRDGERLVVSGPNPQAPVVASVIPRSAAADVGMSRGDVVLAVEGEAVTGFDRIVELVEASGGRALLFEVWRDGERIEFVVTPRPTDLPGEDGSFTTSWKIGLQGGLVFDVETDVPGVLEALAEALRRLWLVLASSLAGFWAMLTGAISTCNLSGPVGIAETSGAMASQGPLDFVWFLGVLSAAVGLMNLFPIPILDGGHLVFHAWEGVTGRPPGDRALRVLMTAGLSVILALMAFAVANDLFLCP